MKGSSKDIISINVIDILKFCFPGGESKKINLPGGIIFIKEGEFVYIYNSAIINYKDLFLDTKQDFTAFIPTEISKNEIKSLLNSLKYKKPGQMPQMCRMPMILKGEIIKSINSSNYRLKIKIINTADYDKKHIIHSERNEACLDLNKIKFPISIRKWQYGDKFMPLGMDNEKKLQDFYGYRSSSSFQKRCSCFL